MVQSYHGLSGPIKCMQVKQATITFCAHCDLKYKQNTIDNPNLANKGAEVSYLAV